MRAVRIIFLSFFLFFGEAAVCAQGLISPKYEYRAVWVTTIENLDWPHTQVKTSADIEVQKRELVQMLDSLRMLNVNTVMLQTRVRGDVLYPSEIEPFSKVLTGVAGQSPGYDPFAFAIEECHKRGMQLHAWIVTLPLGKVRHVRELGRHALKNKLPQLCRVYRGSWYMEPGEPGTVDYLRRLVNEIVSKYDVDGIHLDYVRYPDYAKSYPDNYLYRRYGNGMSLADWRRNNITRIVRGIYNEVKFLKPWVRVSCAPLGKYDDLTAYSSRGYNALHTVFQDARLWLDEGIMDMLFPMLYFQGNDFYPFVLDWQENANGRHIVPGIGAYRLLKEYGDWDVDEVRRQLLTSRNVGTSGTAMFRARHLLDNIKGFTDVYSHVCNRFVPVPPITWGTAAAPEAPQGFFGVRSGDSLTLRWNTVASAEGMPAMRYNIYASTDSAVDISKADNLMAVGLRDTLFTWNGSTLGAMHWAVVAVDAYGMEGEAALWSERGHVPTLMREVFYFPPPATWGMKLVLRDAVGAVLYKGRYRSRIGVRGLPPGMYLMEVVSREGTVLKRIPFCR